MMEYELRETTDKLACLPYKTWTLFALLEGVNPTPVVHVCRYRWSDILVTPCRDIPSGMLSADDWIKAMKKIKIECKFAGN